MIKVERNGDIVTIMDLGHKYISEGYGGSYNDLQTLEGSNTPKQEEEDVPDFDQAAVKRLRDEVTALLEFVKGGQQDGIHNFKNVYVPADKLRKLEKLLKCLK